MRAKLTENQKEFIHNNFKDFSRKVLAEKLGVTIYLVNGYARKNNLKVSKETLIKFRTKALKGRTTFTPKEDEFIVNNYLKLPIKTIATKLKRSGCGVTGRMKALNLVVPPALTEKRKQASYYKPGRVPENKGKKQSEYMGAEAIERSKATRFKKGSKPQNFRQVGSERVNVDGYVEIKIKDPNIWRLKQQYVYENFHNCKIPSTHNIIFNDGNKQNFEIENLTMLSDAELMSRNTIHRYPQALKELIRLKGKLKKTIENDSSTRKTA